MTIPLAGLDTIIEQAKQLPKDDPTAHIQVFVDKVTGCVVGVDQPITQNPTSTHVNILYCGNIYRSTSFKNVERMVTNRLRPHAMKHQIAPISSTKPQNKSFKNRSRKRGRHEQKEANVQRRSQTSERIR